MKTFVADFETTTNPNDCRVWAYAICDIEELDTVIVGNSMDNFMKWCSNKASNNKVLFHNLKFDGSFIVSYLIKNGFTHVTDKKMLVNKSFTTLISDKGLWYQIQIMFSRNGKKTNKVIIEDSYKILPMSVDKIAKSFKLPISKLEIDYKEDRPVGHILTKQEIDYIQNDVKIVAHAVKYLYDQGMTKMTTAGNAMNEYKTLINKKNFQTWYPIPTYDEDVRQSYRGGFTYLNPKFANKTIKNGIVLDVNSLYPSVMYNDYLPFGQPIFYKGQYKDDKIYPLYVQMITCEFELKPGKIPTIQIKHLSTFVPNEYLTSSDNQIVALCLTSIDLKLFLEHYDVSNLEYISGWKFKATRGLFTKYIDKWSGNKIQAKKDGNGGLYYLSKLMLNSLYGKFGTSTKVRSQIPYLDSEGTLKFSYGEIQEKEGVYIGLASFITSYARLKTISSAQKIQDDYHSGKSNIEFVYADTDSLHCKSDNFELPEGLDIDPTILGYWKYESKFNKAKFLRQKCYIEQSTEDIENDNPEYELKVTVAGMPKGCYPFVNFSNFKVGANYKGKLQPKRVPGGVVLADVDFTIKM